METKGSSSNQYKSNAHWLSDCLEGFDDSDDTFEQLLDTRFTDMKKFTPAAAIFGMQLTSSLSTTANPPLCLYPVCRPLATSTPRRVTPPMLAFKAFSQRSDVAATSLEAHIQNDSMAPDVLESNTDVVKEQSNAKAQTTRVNADGKRNCAEVQSAKIECLNYKKIKYESVLTLHQLRNKRTAL